MSANDISDMCEGAIYVSNQVSLRQKGRFKTVFERVPSSVKLTRSLQIYRMDSLVRDS